MALLGALLLAAASFLGRPELAIFGTLLVALPLAAWAVSWWRMRPGRRHPSTVQRRLSEAATVGGQAQVQVTVDGHHPGPGRETLRGFRPQHATSRAHEPLTYAAHFPLRGAYRLGPFLSVQADPLGLVLRTQAVDPGLELAVQPLPARQLSDGEWEDLLPSRALKGSEADALSRPYQEGDPYRRIHWPVSARQGRMMVRPDAEDHDGVPAVALDRHRAHYGGIPTWVHLADGGRAASTAGYDEALRTAVAAAHALRKGAPGAELVAFPAWSAGRGTRGLQDGGPGQALLASSVPTSAFGRPPVAAGAGSLLIITGVPGAEAASWPARHSRRRVTVLMHAHDGAAPPPPVLSAWEHAGWTWRTLQVTPQPAAESASTAGAP